MIIKKTLLAFGIGMVIPAMAHASFSNSSLKGNYVVNLSGAAVDNNGDVGGLSANGIMTFDGFGGVAGVHLQFTYADNSKEQASCNVVTSDLGPSDYIVSPNGQGEIDLSFESDECMLADDLSIGFTLARATGATSQLLAGDDGDDFLEITTFVDGSFFAVEEIQSFTLRGSMYLQSPAVIPR